MPESARVCAASQEGIVNARRQRDGSLGPLLRRDERPTPPTRPPRLQSGGPSSRPQSGARGNVATAGAIVVAASIRAAGAARRARAADLRGLPRRPTGPGSPGRRPVPEERRRRRRPRRRRGGGGEAPVEPRLQSRSQHHCGEPCCSGGAASSVPRLVCEWVKGEERLLRQGRRERAAVPSAREGRGSGRAACRR